MPELGLHNCMKSALTSVKTEYLSVCLSVSPTSLTDTNGSHSFPAMSNKVDVFLNLTPGDRVLPLPDTSNCLSLSWLFFCMFVLFFFSYYTFVLAEIHRLYMATDQKKNGNDTI